MDVEIPMKEHEDQMQRTNNERFEKLKAKCCKVHPQLSRLPQPTHPTMMDPALNKALEKDDVNHFIDTLEQVLEGLCLCTIFDHQVSSSGNSLPHEAAKFGSIKITKLIINHFPHLLTKQNFIGDTILHVALKAKKINIIEALIKSSSSSAVMKNSGIMFSQQLKLEEKHGGSSEGLSPAYDHKKSFQMKNHIGNTALHEAVRTGHSNEVINDLLLVNPEALYSLNKEGQSPFFLAVETENKDICHNKDICQLLLRATKRNGDLVGRPRNKDIRQLLLRATKRNGDLEGRPREELPVYVAILRKRKDILEEIFNEKPELFNIRDKKGKTPLHFAVSTCDFEGTQFLLKKFRQSFLERSTKGDLPIHIACKKDHVEIVKMLLKQHSKEEQWNDHLTESITECINAQGQNILHVAAKSGSNRVVKYILGQRNLDLDILLNSKDKNGNTALHLASMDLHTYVILSLTWDKRVELSLLNNEGFNALDIVVEKGDQLSIRKLLTGSALRVAGIPVNEKGKNIILRYSEEQDRIKDYVNLLSVIAVLVATVSFTAGLTVPGGFNSSDHGPAGDGMATLANKKMFQVFIICDTIAMYCSVIGAFILSWSGISDVTSSILIFAILFLLIAVFTMCMAFISAVYLVVSKIYWLSNVVLIVGITFLTALVILYTLWLFPFGISHPVFYYISHYTIPLMLPFTQSYGKVVDHKQKKVRPANKDKQEEYRPVANKFYSCSCHAPCKSVRMDGKDREEDEKEGEYIANI